MLKLSEDQRRNWAVDGYLYLEGVLTPDEIEFFSSEMDRIRCLPGWEPGADLPRGHYKWQPHSVDLDPEGFMDRRDILSYHDAFVELIDRPVIFDYIVDIMGPNILFSMSQAIVRASTDKFPGYTHTDGGQALAQIRVTETSRPIAMKAIYLLTDVEGSDCGAFTVFPGSHLRPFPVHDPTTVSPHSPGSVQLLGKGRRLFPVLPCALAWSGTQLVGEGAQDAALQLLSDVRSFV